MDTVSLPRQHLGDHRAAERAQFFIGWLEPTSAAEQLLDINSTSERV